MRCEIAGQLVGYVTKDESREISKYMKKKQLAKLQVNANVRGGWHRSKTDHGFYGVTVEINPEMVES